MFCKFCGTQIDANSVFCPNCGKNQGSTGTNATNYSVNSSVSVNQGSSNPEMARVYSMIDSATGLWKKHMIAVFAVWAAGLIALFSGWFEFDVLYSEKVTLFDVCGYIRDYAYIFDEDSMAVYNVIQFFIIGSCILFLVLLGLTIKNFIEEYEDTSKYAIALSSAEIAFAVIIILSVRIALNQDDLASMVFSITSAPYLFIASAVVAIIITLYAKNNYEQEMMRIISIEKQIKNSSSANISSGYRSSYNQPAAAIPESTTSTFADETGNILDIVADSNGIKISGLRNRNSVNKVILPPVFQHRAIIEIDNDAFKGSSNLQSVTLPPSVIRIGNAAFCDCTALSEITLPERLEVIESWAFCNCTSLTKITIPASVTDIADTAFSGCSITVCAPHEPSYYGYEQKANIKCEVN